MGGCDCVSRGRKIGAGEGEEGRESRGRKIGGGSVQQGVVGLDIKLRISRY